MNPHHTGQEKIFPDKILKYFYIFRIFILLRLFWQFISDAEK